MKPYGLRNWIEDTASTLGSRTDVEVFGTCARALELESSGMDDVELFIDTRDAARIVRAFDMTFSALTPQQAGRPFCALDSWMCLWPTGIHPTEGQDAGEMIWQELRGAGYAFAPALLLTLGRQVAAQVIGQRDPGPARTTNDTADTAMLHRAEALTASALCGVAIATMTDLDPRLPLVQLGTMPDASETSLLIMADLSFGLANYLRPGGDSEDYWNHLVERLEARRSVKSIANREKAHRIAALLHAEAAAHLNTIFEESGRV